VRNQRETGISAAQEIGFALYIGAATLKAAVSRGVAVDMVAPRITFFLNSFDDFLEEIAKFRAARRMGARLLRERFGAEDPRSWAFRFHVQTSGVSLTAQQPLVNIIRATLHALAAVLGGAQSLSVNAFDEALAIPSRLAQTLSLRTQQVIAYESGVTAVADPLGGSWCIEHLTDEVEKRAWQVYEELERLGPERAWREMSAQGHEAAYQRQLAIERGERVVVGVNRFMTPPEEDDPVLELLARDTRRDPPFDPAWREKQIKRLMQVKQGRDEAQAQAARRRLQEAYRERANILPPTIEAVKAYLSIGEICGALAEVEGWEALRKRGGFLLRLYG
jgi:methylmalonyl-CoA mutase N-terminal domain/subunit